MSANIETHSIVATIADPTPSAPQHRRYPKGNQSNRKAKVLSTSPVAVDHLDRARIAPAAELDRVLLLHARDVRVEFRYVAGKPIFADSPCPQKVGALIVGTCKEPEKLRLLDVVDAILAAIDNRDPSAPPQQRARFQSLAMRFDLPRVPYWLRSVFLDVGQSPAVANSTSRTVVLAASRFRVATEVAEHEYPTLREALQALRRLLAASPSADETPSTLRPWQR